MKMIEMRMGQQHEINRRQVLDFQSAAFDSFEKKQPVGEVGIYQDVQIRELHQERGVADPRHSHLPRDQLWKRGLPMLSGSTRQQSFPHHLPKKSARVEMF